MSFFIAIWWSMFMLSCPFAIDGDRLTGSKLITTLVRLYFFVSVVFIVLAFLNIKYGYIYE